SDTTPRIVRGNLLRYPGVVRLYYLLRERFGLRHHVVRFRCLAVIGAVSRGGLAVAELTRARKSTCDGVGAIRLVDLGVRPKTLGIRRPVQQVQVSKRNELFGSRAAVSALYLKGTDYWMRQCRDQHRRHEDE